MERATFFQLTLAIFLGFAFAMVFHDSGAQILGILRTTVEQIFLPLFISMVLSYLLAPLINRLERAGVRRMTGILVVYALLLLFAALLFYMFWSSLFYQILEFRQSIPNYVTRVMGLLLRAQYFIQREFGSLGFAKVDLTQSLGTLVDSHKSALLNFTLGTVNVFVSVAILVPLFSFFFLKDGRTLKRAIIRRVPNRYFESVLVIFHHVNLSLGSFVRGRFWECSIVGTITFLGLHLVGLNYAWLFGLLAGVTALVPVFGTLAGFAVTLGFALLDSSDPFLGLWVFVVYVFAHFIDSVFLVPVFVVKSASLHFMTGILAIIVGGIVGGILGMVVAVPVVSIFKLVLQEVIRHWSTNEIFKRPYLEKSVPT